MPELNKDSTDQSDFDASAAIAEISADLFGQGGESGEDGAKLADAGAEVAPPLAESTETAPLQQPAESSEEAKPPEENASQVQATGAPKTWSKEALAEWATLPPRAQQEILKREDDFLKGITMYKDKAEIGSRYEQVVDPYRPILAAESIDPVQMFQSFAANHYILSRGTEAQKLELAANMIAGYQIDFNKLISFVGDRITEPSDPRVTALEQEIAALKQGQTSRQQQETAQIQQRLSSEIETFAADPANQYFSELVDDIAKLFEAGQATDLKEAYDKAVYMNPTTRQKEIERLTAEKSNSTTAAQQARMTKIAKSTAADLSIDPRARSGTVPIGSLDDTLQETLARIQGRA